MPSVNKAQLLLSFSVRMSADVTLGCPVSAPIDRRPGHPKIHESTVELKLSCTNYTLMRLVLVAGTTRTAAVDGISAAGATPALLEHTPSADAEILVYGRPVRSPVVPVSPTGCPTPAAVTRAVRECTDLDVTVVDAGLAEPTAAPTVTLDANPGADIRSAEAVPGAAGIYEAAREYGRLLPGDDHLYVGETVPGGTTTALGVLRALGEQATVSSSLPDNPLERKRELVAEGLAASDIAEGDAFGDPVAALRLMGDPVLAGAAGLVRGALETDTPVTLAGGTQLLAVAALLRHDGVEDDLDLATTSFVAADDSADLDGLAAALDVTVAATDPGFDELAHPAAEAYCAGEAKEGVGMGGALRIADRSEVSLETVREQFCTVTDRLAAVGEDDPETDPDDTELADQ